MLHLSDVSLVCVDTRDVDLALKAIGRCMAQVRFARVMLFTRSALVSRAPEGIEVIDVDVPSVQAYSEFMLRGLAPHVSTSHVLVAQWDGFVRDASRWDPAFLDHDYIGAPWHDQPPERAVGNGGFSLRSQRLLQALRDPRLRIEHPEDVAICHTNRALLEREHGIRIAPIDVARRFAYERVLPSNPTFGFHGLFNFDREIPPEDLRRTLSALSDGVVRGLEVHDLCDTLIAQGRLASASYLLDRRWQMGLRDRRTLRLAWRMYRARRRGGTRSMEAW
ncbi:MAG: DUF5672 family protein [Burkholderiaceae bacterium]